MCQIKEAGGYKSLFLLNPFVQTSFKKNAKFNKMFKLNMVIRTENKFTQQFARQIQKSKAFSLVERETDAHWTRRGLNSRGELTTVAYICLYRGRSISVPQY
jgi:hypothetical protein